MKCKLLIIKGNTSIGNEVIIFLLVEVKILSNFIIILKSKFKMVKVYPLNTAIPIKNNDDNYNCLYGAVLGMLICLFIFIIIYSKNNSDGSY